MQPKFTLNQWRSYVKFIPAMFLFFLFGGILNAQQYVNGNLSTGPTSSNGTAAPAGTTWSEVQAGNTVAGYTNNITGFMLADDFTISCGTWNLTKITFFAYGTGFAGPTSPYNNVRVAIYNSNPSVGNPAPIFGDLTTNRFLASTDATMYRIFNAAPATNRRIWRIEATVATTLGPGTYWIQWGLGSTFASNFSPASTVVGTQTQPGNNALQRTVASNTWAPLVDGGTPQDMQFIIDYTSAACAGTPAPGNTLSTAATACPGINFTLSLQNCTPGSGVTYQWQSSPDNVAWTNIAGATSPTLVRNHSAATWYRCQVTCSGNTGTSNPLQVLLTPPSGCYCLPGATDCTDNDVITRVRISTLDNSSGCGSGPPPGYSNFTTSVPAPNVYSGAANPITLDLPPNWSEFLAVWIDYNKNGAFEASEYTNIGNKPAGQTVITGAINIPTSALTGITRMRVRTRFAAALTSGQACIGYAFGETEDYNVNITPCIPGAFVSMPANTSIQCSGNAAFTVTATGSLLTFSWQYRPNASSAWQTVPNAAPYSFSSTTSSATLTITNTPSTLNGYQYRALMTGGCSAVDFTSPPATLTVNPLVATVNPASATICTGSSQQLTLTNASSPVTQTFNATAGLPLAIPDANAAGVNNSINISLPAGSIISGVAARFSIPAHTWAGDLVVVLKAPNGAVLNLDYGVSATGVGPTPNPPGAFVNTVISSTGTAALSSGVPPFTGTFRADAIMTPTAPLGVPAGPTGFLPTVNTFSGLYSVPNGNWTLAIYDAFGGDIGSLTAWSLDITYGAPAAGVWTASPAGNTMWTNAALTTPYVAGTPVNTIWVNPTVSTNYSVVYSTATPCVSAPTVIPVTVVNPVSSVVNPVNRAVCVGGSTSFTVSASGGPITYQWQVSTDGGTTWTNIGGATSATLNLNGVTQSMNNYRYRAVLTAAPCAGSTNSGAAILTVNALPVVTISSPDVSLAPGQITTITASSTPAAAAGGWSWTLNHSGIPGNTNTQTVNLDGMGIYQATVTDINGCVSSSNELEIGAEASDRLWIYPNPTTGQFQVRLYYASNVAEKRTVTIYNQLGQVIQSKQFALVAGTPPYLQMDFDLGHVSRGIYAVKVAHQFTGKVISGLVIVD